jgi:hypothetical protein
MNSTALAMKAGKAATAMARPRPISVHYRDACPLAF